MKPLLVLISVFVAISLADELPQIKKLRKQLLETYDKMARPVKNHETQTSVDIRVTIVKINYLDIKRQALSLEAWIQTNWTDEHLTWNPRDFGGVTQLHFGATEIWKPDIVLISSADSSSMLTAFAASHLTVENNGQVRWFCPTVLTSICAVYLADYPNDVQQCYLEFSPWTYEVHQVNLTTDPQYVIFGGIHVDNPDWTVGSIHTWRYDMFYEGYGNFSSVEIDVTLTRNAGLYKYVIKIPATAAVLLSLAMFWLPLNSGIRLTLGTTSIFIYLALLLTLGYQLGIEHFSAPTVVANMSVNMMLVTMAIILSVVVRKLHSWVEYMPILPHVIMTIFEGPLGKLFCYGSEHSTQEGDQLTNAEEGDSNHTGAKKASSQNSATEWGLLVLFLDRLLFVVYAIIMLIRHA